jgi:hypothetical protein
VAESPSALLERAAIHLAALSNDATPGTWFTTRPVDGYVCVRAEPGAPVADAAEAPCDEADGAWIATLSPAVARPLFTWLKSEAVALDRYGVVWGEPEGRLPEHTQAALEFARMVLSEVGRG